MNHKHRHYLLYYSLLGLLLVTQVAFTLYKTSLVVVHSQRQQKLSQASQELQQKEQRMRVQLSAQNSLLTVTQDEQLAAYQPISQPIVLHLSDNLAAAQ